MSTAALNSRLLVSEVAGKLRKRATLATCGSRRVLPHHHAVGAVLSRVENAPIVVLTLDRDRSE